MSLIFLILGILLIGWGLYQIKTGSAYGGWQGDLILYDQEWVRKSDSPRRFWSIVIIEILIGGIFIYLWY